MDVLARLDEADDRWSAAEQAAADLKDALFQACAEAVQAGHTPDEIAERLRARKTPQQIEAGFTFSGSYIRRIVRRRGITPLPSGPKPRPVTPE